MRDRPFSNLDNQELYAYFNKDRDNIEKLKDIAYESAFRNYMLKDQRAEIIEALINSINSAQNKQPEFIFPSISVVETRKNIRASLGYPVWQDIGLLKASGYAVGKTNGIKSSERQKILNYIFLRDDLSDIDDRAYASEWGSVKSEKRLKKIADCISTFANNALRNPNDMSSAIREWSEDLNYIKVTYYDGWAMFPWPEIEDEYI